MLRERIIEEVNRLQPSGDTALTDAVQIAAEVLDYKSSPATIVLVTDGKETCGGMPCALGRRPCRMRVPTSPCM